MERFRDAPIDALVERAKELECLYLIDEALMGSEVPAVFSELIRLIPIGFRDQKSCTAEIELDGRVYSAKPVGDYDPALETPIVVSGEHRGLVRAMYRKGTFAGEPVLFLENEVKLMQTISARIADRILKSSLLPLEDYRRDWKAIVHLLQKSDHELLLYLCQHMLALIADVSPKLALEVFAEMGWTEYHSQGEINFPLDPLPDVNVGHLSEILFRAASSCLDDRQIYDRINLWIYQGKTYELVKIVNKRDADISLIRKALNQYLKVIRESGNPSQATRRWLTVELSRRFLTDHPKLIDIAQKYITVEDFSNLLDVYLSSPNGIGKIGGKGSGFFIANKILALEQEESGQFSQVRIPKTWFISAEELPTLIESNGLDELNEFKYRDLSEIRTNYPRIIQMIKSARLSSYVYDQLGRILDDCGDKPLIVRSSSLLEDQIDTSFSGKYKSLFIIGAGTNAARQQRLEEGVLEVYASLFNPDSIQYRKERGLLDCVEKMGILVQEVVGRRVGPYYFPLYSGVAFSQNELRWSPRIRREDGLLRMVMGLGTRAVDRVGEDFPILISPGQPGLRVNQSLPELKKYSPQMIDVLDVEQNRFLTLPIAQLLRDYGSKIPHIGLAASQCKFDFVTEANPFTSNFTKDEFVITFDGLVQKTPFVSQMQAMLQLLQEKLGYPVDIEFASDGEHFYLLQCRPQSRNYDNSPVAIPSDIPYQDIVFTANKYVSNGRVCGIKFLVYVDPYAYSQMERYDDFLQVRTAVSKLNSLLPRRSFILMGPGRWGSRGDIKLGVPVSYSDINNTAMLIEIALEESRYQPDLSFGTHFFQDLVEENIKYLPLYPEDRDVVFKKAFFQGENILSKLLPAFSHLGEVIKVIRLEESFPGKELFVFMNADLERAVAFLDRPQKHPAGAAPLRQDPGEAGRSCEESWKWRHYMAERLAQQLDMDALGVKGIYLFGSTNACTAGLGSDIDLLIHIDGDEQQRQELDTWLEGWSLALSEMNFLKTGYSCQGLLDVHYVTDEDIANKDSYALKINSLYDPAQPLRLR